MNQTVDQNYENVNEVCPDFNFWSPPCCSSSVHHVSSLPFFLCAVFAWEAYERGSDVHLQADPTKLELLHQSFRVKKEDFKEKQKESILEKV